MTKQDELEGRVIRIEAKTERTEQDIQKIFKSLEKLPFWILGSMSIPTLGIAYQIITNLASK